MNDEKISWYIWWWQWWRRWWPCGRTRRQATPPLNLPEFWGFPGPLFLGYKRDCDEEGKLFFDKLSLHIILVGFLSQLCFEGLTDLTEAETMAGAPPDLLFRAIFYWRRILSPMLCNVMLISPSRLSPSSMSAPWPHHQKLFQSRRSHLHRRQPAQLHCFEELWKSMWKCDC